MARIIQDDEWGKINYQSGRELIRRKKAVTRVL
jgi:hypothetical protein